MFKVLTHLIYVIVTVSDQPPEPTRLNTRAGGARLTQNVAADDGDDLTDDESITELQETPARPTSQGNKKQ